MTNKLPKHRVYADFKNGGIVHEKQCQRVEHSPEPTGEAFWREQIEGFDK